MRLVVKAVLTKVMLVFELAVVKCSFIWLESYMMVRSFQYFFIVPWCFRKDESVSPCNILNFKFYHIFREDNNVLNLCLKN